MWGGGGDWVIRPHGHRPPPQAWSPQGWDAGDFPLASPGERSPCHILGFHLWPLRLLENKPLSV